MARGRDVAEVVATLPSQSEAARRLGVDRSTLHRWLKAGNVQWSVARERGAMVPRLHRRRTRRRGVGAKVREDTSCRRTEEVLVVMSVATIRLSQTSGCRPRSDWREVGRFRSRQAVCIWRPRKTAKRRTFVLMSDPGVDVSAKPVSVDDLPVGTEFDVRRVLTTSQGSTRSGVSGDDVPGAGASGEETRNWDRCSRPSRCRSS